MTPHGVSATYGTRGFGGADFHFVHFGSHATYNRANMVLDLRTILQIYRPDQIFTTGGTTPIPITRRPTTSCSDALQIALAADSTYRPVVNKTVVWSACCDFTWPLPPDPANYHTILPDIPAVPLSWNRAAESRCAALHADHEPRRQHQVSGDPGLHFTSGRRALRASSRASRRRTSSSGRRTRAAAHAPPVVNAGTDQHVPPGAPVSLNGGAGSDPNGQSLTYQWTQSEGPTVSLSGANTASPTFTAPAVTQFTSLAFRLVVRDSGASPALRIASG